MVNRDSRLFTTPRADNSTRTSIECTFPPRKWDDSLGRLVTVRQPNQRRKPRAPDQPVAQPPSATVDAVHGSAFPTPDSAVPTQVFTQQSQQFAPIDPCKLGHFPLFFAEPLP